MPVALNVSKQVVKYSELLTTLWVDCLHLSHLGNYLVFDYGTIFFLISQFFHLWQKF